MSHSGEEQRLEGESARRRNQAAAGRAAKERGAAVSPAGTWRGGVLGRAGGGEENRGLAGRVVRG